MDNGNGRMTFARALFDNVAEMPRELSFKKGDILTVLQEKYENNSEWWVCSLRNMVGLAPANRLEAMPVLIQNRPVYQSQVSASTYDELPEQPVLGHTYSNVPQNYGVTDDSYSTYQLPKEDIYVNPLPTSEYSEDHSIYQIPASSDLDDTYSNTLTETSYSPAPSSKKSDNIRLVSSKETFANEYYNDRYDYSDSFSDATSTSFTESSTHSANQFSLTSSDSGDFRSIQRDSSTILVMSPEEAIAKFRQFHSDTTASCNKVIELVKSKWKSEEVLKLTINSIQQSFTEFNNSLILLINFAIGVYQNSLNCADVTLTKKIGKHVSPLQECKQIIKDSLETLGTMNWEPERIAISVRLAVRDGADALGQVVSAARNVLIHTRSLSVTINGNASILFTNTTIPSGMVGAEESGLRTIIKREKSEDRSSGVQDVLRLFAQQLQSQVQLVNETVDDFMTFISSRNQDLHFQETVTNNSKFVVRSATQLVCIAKNLSDTNIKSVPCQKIEEAGNRLCDSLKSMINTTKQLITDRKWSMDQKDELIRQLKTVKTNSNQLQSIVISAVF